MDHINAVLQEGDPENTLLALKKPEAQLPAVHPFAAALYQNELFNLQKQNASVRRGSQGWGAGSPAGTQTQPQRPLVPVPGFSFPLTLAFRPRGKW